MGMKSLAVISSRLGQLIRSSQRCNKGYDWYSLRYNGPECNKEMYCTSMKMPVPAEPVAQKPTEAADHEAFIV